jgi:hypothetical protein
MGDEQLFLAVVAIGKYTTEDVQKSRGAAFPDGVWDNVVQKFQVRHPSCPLSEELVLIQLRKAQCENFVASATSQSQPARSHVDLETRLKVRLIFESCCGTGIRLIVHNT